MAEEWRSLSHEIDAKAQGIFNKVLPGTYSAVPQDPDYGVDYRVEIFSEGKKTGKHFGVQLKGGTKFSMREPWKYPFSVKALKSYVDVERQPVFLVLVDVTTEETRWLFLQEYSDKYLSGKNWRTQRTVTVKVPLRNNFQNADLFSVAVEEALEYVRKKSPGGIIPSIKHEERRLETLDPRFQVKARADANNVEFRLEPKQEVSLTMILALRDNRDRLEDWIERGHSIQFNPGEVKIEGSELFKESDEYGVKISPDSSLDGQLVMSTNEGPSKNTLITLPASFRHGRSEGQLTADAPDCPFTIEIGVKRNEPGVAKCTFSMWSERWFGLDVPQLPYADQLYLVAQAINAKQLITVEFVHKGNTLLSYKAQRDWYSGSGDFVGLICTCRCARQIALRLSLRPKLKPELLTDHWGDICELHHVLFTSDSRLLVPNLKLQFPMTLPQAKELIKLADPSTRQIGLVCIETNTMFKFFDHAIVVERLKNCFNMTTIANHSEIEESISSNATSPIPLCLEGNSDSFKTVAFHDNVITVEELSGAPSQSGWSV